MGSTGYDAAFEPAMREALAEAVAAAGLAAGVSSADEGGGGGGFDVAQDADVPVGAVVLDRSGAVIARGRNRREATGDPTAHAEIEAIRAAGLAIGGWRLDGCTLVVTLEPCTMCTGAVTASRLARLVYGAPDPKAGAAGSLWDVLRDRRLGHMPEVIGGVLEQDCGALLRDFFASRRATKR